MDENIKYIEDLDINDAKMRIFDAFVNGEIEPFRVIIVNSLIDYGNGETYHVIYEDAIGEHTYKMMKSDEIYNKYKIKL